MKLSWLQEGEISSGGETQQGKLWIWCLPILPPQLLALSTGLLWLNVALK